MDHTGKRYERDHDQGAAKPRTWKWFLTITAIQQWMELTGRGGDMEDDNPEFVEAMEELGAVSQVAELAIEASDKQKGGSVYRAPAIVKGKRLRLRGKGARVECVVMPPIRKEGPLPQLVRVTIK